MRRRDFITLLGGAAATWPLAARAQPGLPAIGWLDNVPLETRRGDLVPFRQGLNDVGYIVGQNVAIPFVARSI
jgi:putative ABC transport system substrate-binding protein